MEILNIHYHLYAILFDRFLPSLTESGVTAIRYRLHVFCINHTPPRQLQFPQLMFPAIVLPVTGCLSAEQGRGDGPVANSLSGSAHPAACCSLWTWSLSGIPEAVCPNLYFRILYLHPEHTYPSYATAVLSRL